MGKAAIVSEPIQQGLKQISKHAPGFLNLLKSADNLGTVKAQSKVHRNSFYHDFQGSINTGILDNYVNDLPDNWLYNFNDYANKLENSEDLAAFSDLIVRAANDEPGALLGVKQAADTLELENQARIRQTKGQRIVQNQGMQPEVPETPSLHNLTGADEATWKKMY